MPIHKSRTTNFVTNFYNLFPFKCLLSISYYILILLYTFGMHRANGCELVFCVAFGTGGPLPLVPHPPATGFGWLATFKVSRLYVPPEHISGVLTFTLFGFVMLHWLGWIQCCSTGKFFFFGTTLFDERKCTIESFSLKLKCMVRHVCWNEYKLRNDKGFGVYARLSGVN